MFYICAYTITTLPTMQDILRLTALAVCFLTLFGVAEWLYHYQKVKVELTRKLVHVGTGVLTLLFPVFLGNHWLVLLLCSSFAMILIASLQYNLLPSINAIDRKSHGSLLYPVAVYICYLAYSFYGYKVVLFYLPVLTLAICDPLAALFGKRYPYGKYRLGASNKTLVGSSAFLVSSWILAALMLHYFDTKIWHCVWIAPLATIAEAMSGKGTDNLTIPLTVLGILLYFQ